MIRKSKIILNLFCFLCITFNNACSSDKDTLINELKKIIGKKISYPTEMILFNMPDSLNRSIFDSTEYKILVFVDSTICSECKMKSMLPWNEYFDKFNTLHIPTMIIINTGDILQFNKTAKEVNITFPYFYDINSNFKLHNYISQQEHLRTFLLKKDTIIAVGDPIYNPQILALYLKKISEK